MSENKKPPEEKEVQEKEKEKDQIDSFEQMVKFTLDPDRMTMIRVLRQVKKK